MHSKVEDLFYCCSYYNYRRRSYNSDCWSYNKRKGTEIEGHLLVASWIDFLGDFTE
jgi:hypothetical protein